MSCELEEFGDGDRDGLEQAESRESARSIFPVLISFGGGSGAEVGESGGLPFDTGEGVTDEGMAVYEI